MKRSIVAAILILFVAAACLAAISGERPVASPAYGAPPGYRHAAASASDGHDFLVVWRDSSRSRSYSYERTYAARIDTSGHVLDPLGIRIPTLTANPTQVNVVYLGNAYLVCWIEGDVSASTSPAAPLVGVRISGEGQVLDSEPRVFVDKARLSTGGVASNGSRAIIAYTSASGSLMTIVLDRDANVVDGPRTLANPAGGLNETALAASNGRGFLVVRSFGNTNYTATTALDANGLPLPATPPLIDTPGGIFSLASDGDSYVALFQAPGQITAQHFGASGESLETSLFPLQQVFPSLFYRYQQVFPSLVFDGNSYLFMDGDPAQKTLGIRRLTRTGQPIGGYNPIAKASSTTTSSLWYNTTLAYNGSGIFAGWGEAVFTGSVIEGISLAASSPFVIARAATTQIKPAAATSGTNTAIVWNEDDGGVYVGRLTLDGQSLDGRGIRVAGSNVTQPHIAFDGVNYIIGWREQDPADRYKSTLKLARYAPGTGTLLDPNGVVISQKSYGTLAFAPAPNGTLLTWTEGGHVVASILGRDLSHGPAVIADPAEDIGSVDVSAAWTGSEWLLTWLKPVVPPGGGPLCDPVPCYNYVIYAARLSSQLALLDPKSIVVSDTLDTYGPPLIASDGDGFLIAWSRYGYDYFSVEGGYESSVYAQRISRDGSLLGPVNGVRLSAGQARSVVWDGLQYDVAFTARHYPAYFAASFTTTTANLNVAHLAAHGAIESLTPQTVITDLSDPDASLIVTGTGSITVAYTRIGTEPEYGDVERVFVTVPHMIRGRASR